MCQSNIALKNFCVFEKKHKIPIFYKSCLGVMYRSNIDLKRFSIFSCFRKTHLRILSNTKKTVKKKRFKSDNFIGHIQGGPSRNLPCDYYPIPLKTVPSVAFVSRVVGATVFFSTGSYYTTRVGKILSCLKSKIRKNSYLK